MTSLRAFYYQLMHVLVRADRRSVTLDELTGTVKNKQAESRIG